ncbi:MAG: hypothetical protein IKQ96_01940 [Lachnospiraceae bacterium]|nr:hypothetical protein [Lachnospiraceae bacterium]
MNDMRGQLPAFLSFVPAVLAAAEYAMVLYGIRDAFQSEGNVSWISAALMLLALFLSAVGLIVAGLVLLRKPKKPAVTIVGMVFNAIILVAVLAVYAIGF